MTTEAKTKGKDLAATILANVRDGLNDPEAHDRARWERDRKAKPLALKGKAPAAPALDKHGLHRK